MTTWLGALSSGDFTEFAEPAVWNFHVAQATMGCPVATETRMRATDDGARLGQVSL